MPRARQAGTPRIRDPRRPAYRPGSCRHRPQLGGHGHGLTPGPALHSKREPGLNTPSRQGRARGQRSPDSRRRPARKSRGEEIRAGRRASNPAAAKCLPGQGARRHRLRRGHAALDQATQKRSTQPPRQTIPARDQPHTGHACSSSALRLASVMGPVVLSPNGRTFTATVAKNAQQTPLTCSSESRDPGVLRDETRTETKPRAAAGPADGLLAGGAS